MSAAHNEWARRSLPQSCGIESTSQAAQFKAIGREHSVPSGFQEFFCCADTALCLERESRWLRTEFGNQLFCCLKFWFGQHASEFRHIFRGRHFREFEIRIRQ